MFGINSIQLFQVMTKFRSCMWSPGNPARPNDHKDPTRANQCRDSPDPVFTPFIMFSIFRRVAPRLVSLMPQVPADVKSKRRPSGERMYSTGVAHSTSFCSAQIARRALVTAVSTGRPVASAP